MKKNVLLNWIAVIGIASFLSIFAGGFIIAAGFPAIALLSLGVGAWQADSARQEFMKATKKEFIKYLPNIADEQYETVYQTIKDCFENYEREVIKRIDDDIKSRKEELDNLLKQKESIEIDRERESKRLQDLDSILKEECDRIESTYKNLVLSLS